MSLALSPPVAPAPAVPVLVNKSELARYLGISVPTLSSRIDQYPDFPVVQAGTNGTEWKFDPLSVREFLAQKDEEREAAEAARQAAINSQIPLPIEAPGAPNAAALTPQARLAAARAAQVERELARDAALLVVTSEVRVVLNAAFSLLNRHIDSMGLDLARELNLSPDRASALKARLADAKAAFRREIRDYADAARAADHQADLDTLPLPEPVA